MTPLFSPDPYQYRDAIPTSDNALIGSSGLNVTGNLSGLVTQITDNTQPVPGLGLRFTYPNGFGPGAPASIWYGAVPGMPQEMYTGIILRLDSGWPLLNSEGIGKLFEHWVSNNTVPMIVGWEYDDVANSEHAYLLLERFPAPRLTNWLVRAGDPALSGSGTRRITFRPGTWVRLELYTKIHTTTSPANGIAQLWLSTWDGTTRDGSGNAVWSAPALQINWTDVLYPTDAGGFTVWQEYHGVSNTNTSGSTLYQYSNLIHVSRR